MDNNEMSSFGAFCCEIPLLCRLNAGTIGLFYQTVKIFMYLFSALLLIFFHIQNLLTCIYQRILPPTC